MYVHICLSTDYHGLQYYDVVWDSLLVFGDWKARRFCVNEVGLPITYFNISAVSGPFVCIATFP